MRDIIAAGLADLGLLDRVPEQAPSQLAEYGHLLLEKNQVMNLTAITDPVKVAQLHMLDCAALLTCADFQNRALLGRLSGSAPEDPGPLPPGHSAGQFEQAGGLAGSGQRPALPHRHPGHPCPCGGAGSGEGLPGQL